MKDDLPYFSHDNDARNHAKMKALRARFGWTGYGQFWALNEMIAGASQARLDLSRKVVRAAAACELGMTTDSLDDFLKFLADPDECGLVNYEDGVVTTDRTQEDYGRTESGRNHSRERYEAKKKPLSEKKPILAQETPILARETIENRIEENRIEERKEEPNLSSALSRLNKSISIWNSHLASPRFRYMATNIPSEKTAPILRMFGVYSDDEIKKAIENYTKILTNVKEYDAFPRYGGYLGFMATGVELYCDDAKPFDRCRKKPEKQGYQKMGALDDRPDAWTADDIRQMQEDTEQERAPVDLLGMIPDSPLAAAIRGKQEANK